MELTTLQMYWLITLDSIGAATVVAGGIFLLLTIFTIIANDDWFERWHIASACFAIIASIMLSIATFLPTTKQMAAILIVPKIINNEKVQQLPDKVLNLGLEWLEELKPEKKE